MQGNPMTILDSGLHALDPGFEVLDSGPQTFSWILDHLDPNSVFQSPVF